MRKIVIKNNQRIKITDIISVAEKKSLVFLDALVKKNIKENFLLVQKAINKKVYGLTTGVGDLCTKTPELSTDEFQKNILSSHACGAGEYLSRKSVRAIIFSRLLQLSKGMSGVSVELLEFLIDVLNKDTIPLVPKWGSLGVSDLTVLAGIFVVLCNNGKISYNNQLLSPFEAFEKSKISVPKKLKTREGLALINGNDATLGTVSLVFNDLQNFTNLSLKIAALSLLARGGTTSIYDQENQRNKPLKGQKKCSQILQELLFNRQFSSLYENKTLTMLQDPPAYKTIIQLFGTAFDILENTRKIIQIEINGVTDNPLCITNQNSIRFISSGNYLCSSLALQIDQLSLVISSLTAASIARMQILTDPLYNEKLPGYLIADSKNNSGFMILLYTAQSLQSEIKALTFPRSNFSLSVANGWENISTNALNAVYNVEKILTLAKELLAIETILALQAISIRKKLHKLEKVGRISSFIRKLENLLVAKAITLPIETDRGIPVMIHAVKEVIYAL